MSRSICKLMSEHSSIGSLTPLQFVYETDFHKLKKPFFFSIYRLHLILCGTARIKLCGSEYCLKKGDIFIGFPSEICEIEGSDNLEYGYVGFYGDRAEEMLRAGGFGRTEPVAYGYDELIDFWMENLKRCASGGLAMLTSSVLLYTLAITGERLKQTATKGDTLWRNILNYVSENYRDKNLTLKRLAEEFSYTEKYISLLWRKCEGINFREHLNILRTKYAYKLIECGSQSVSEISDQCGYGDPLYFSKVFKKQYGMPPSAMISLCTVK